MSHQSRRTFLTVAGSVLGGIAAGATVTAAERTDRFIVDLKGNSDPASSELDVVYDLSEIGYAVVEGPKSGAERLGTIAPDVEIDLVEPAERVTDAGASAADEPRYDLQWDKQRQELPEVHGVTRGDGTRVSIIDSGVSAGHPDLEHAVDEELSRNFTGDGLGVGGPFGGYHGTHVAGIVAANDDNEAGVVGTAPGAEIVDCRVFSEASEGGGSFASIVAAILYAADIGSDVANLSLGAYPVPRPGLGSFYGGFLNRATTHANREGTLLVTAAGNDAADLQHDGKVISIPNEAAQAVSVSATGPIGFNQGDEGLEEPTYTPANYTNYGTNAVTVAAGGGNYDPALPPGYYYDLVYNCIGEFPSEDTDAEEPVPDFDADPTYSYGWVAGTSMAAPQVAGTAALVKSQNPKSNPNQIESVLKRTARVPDGYDKSYYGAGIVDPLAAVRE